MKLTAQKLVSTLLVCAMGFSVTSCDDDEIAAGVAGAVIGAAIVHGVGSGHHHKQCHRPTREVCSSWYDNWGTYHRDCRIVRNRCYRNSPIDSASNSQETFDYKPNANVSFRSQLDSQGLTEADFAKEYSLGFESAENFIDAMDLSRAGNSEGLLQLGLSSTDLQQMANYELPTTEGISSLAKNLNMKVESTTGMLHRIRAWALTEKVRICAKPVSKLSNDEKKLCNVID